jgi:hypothetical protein
LRAWLKPKGCMRGTAPIVPTPSDRVSGHRLNEESQNSTNGLNQRFVSGHGFSRADPAQRKGLQPLRSSHGQNKSPSSGENLFRQRMGFRPNPPPTRGDASPSRDSEPQPRKSGWRSSRSSPPRDARSPFRRCSAAASACSESSPRPHRQMFPADRS